MDLQLKAASDIVAKTVEPATPQNQEAGYSEEIRLQAVRMYADGAGFRQTARQVGVSHVTVMNWVKAYAAQLPDAPMPEEVDDVEMDELYTFIELG